MYSSTLATAAGGCIRLALRANRHRTIDITPMQTINVWTWTSVNENSFCSCQMYAHAAATATRMLIRTGLNELAGYAAPDARADLPSALTRCASPNRAQSQPSAP